MISLDKLQAVTDILVHKNCADGMASALILRDVLPDANVQFIQYDTPEHRALEAKPGMLFCDFSPHKDSVQAFIDAGAIVLDHHKSQREVVEAFGDNGVYADEKDDPGVSGATLAFREVWRPIAQHRLDAQEGDSLTTSSDAPGLHQAIVKQWLRNAELFAADVAVRDTWQTHTVSWNIAITLNEVLLFYPFESWSRRKDAAAMSLFHPSRWEKRLAERLEVGKLLLQQQAERVDSAIKNGLRFQSTVKHTHVLMFEGVVETSDAAEKLGDQYDLIVGFRYAVDETQNVQLRFSVRSHTGYDCAALAKRYGGGGHTAAAGFSVRGSTVSPFSDFLYRLDQHEGRTL